MLLWVCLNQHIASDGLWYLPRTLPQCDKQSLLGDLGFLMPRAVTGHLIILNRKMNGQACIPTSLDPLYICADCNPLVSIVFSTFFSLPVNQTSQWSTSKEHKSKIREKSQIARLYNHAIHNLGLIWIWFLFVLKWLDIWRFVLFYFQNRESDRRFGAGERAIIQSRGLWCCRNFSFATESAINFNSQVSSH